MANRLLHKSSNVAGKVPAAADISLREIAINTVDGRAFIKTTTDQIITINPPDQVTWNGATAYPGPTCATYAFTGTTDGNGRVVFNITKDGTASGAAIFSNVFTRMSQPYSPCYAFVEAYTAKTVTVRLVLGMTTVLGVLSSTNYAGSGIKVDLIVTGAI